MRGLVRVAGVVAVLAFASGQELGSEQRTVRVPTSRVPASVCVANGRVVAVTQHPDEPGVLHVRCATGVVLVTAAP